MGRYLLGDIIRLAMQGGVNASLCILLAKVVALELLRLAWNKCGHLLRYLRKWQTGQTPLRGRTLLRAAPIPLVEPNMLAGHLDGVSANPDLNNLRANIQRLAAKQHQIRVFTDLDATQAMR